MKIVIVNGQNHKGSTYTAGHMLLDAITCEKEVREFFLPRDLNHFCMGCYSCLDVDEKCPFYEDKQKIMKEVCSADLLIFTTPNYCLEQSAALKTFFDLTFNYWMVHKPRGCMFKKRAVVISTAAGAMTGSAVNPVKRTLKYWGIPYVKTAHFAVHAMNFAGVNEKKKKQIQKKMTHLAKKVSKEKPPVVGIKTKIMFKIFVGMQSVGFGSSPSEKVYWESQGWLGKERPWKQN